MVISFGTLLRLVSIPEIFVISISGFLLPLYLGRNIECGHHRSISKFPAFRILKSFSAGVILGVATLHLLNDALEMLSKPASKTGMNINVP